jgi:uroporphyrinogen III methyltransferase / synthase
VTRAHAQAGALRGLLEAEGAEVLEFPTIRMVPPRDYRPVDRAIARLAEYQWIVFTSQNGVSALWDRMLALGRDARSLGEARLAAIGPGTARALSAQGLRADLAPLEFRAEGLVEAFAHQEMRGTRVLIPRAETARSILPDGLRSLGAVVDVVPVYRIDLARDQDPHIRRRLLAGRVDAVTFTSSSTVRNFVELLRGEAPRALGRAVVACIGPVTAATVREYGLRVDVVAETYTIPGLVASLRAALGSPEAAGAPADRTQRTEGM